MNPLSVSDINNQIKTVLETTFSSVYVEGEISNLTYHNSGHIYFSIKDDKSMISCVMFRGNVQYLKFRLEVGAKVTITGNLTVYAPRGNYQLLCTKISPSGVGELTLAYEQLKAKLQIKGYFNKNIKKTLPKFPDIIYIITSNTGAAIEDMKKVLAHRYPLAKMILLPTLVQGESAKGDIVKNIQRADDEAVLNSDLKSLIIVGRGGGSIEDLWAFNEECVADAIFQANTPIVSAVGHESDFVISDFVADIRASTPSNAIEISTPDINELRIYLDNINDKFKNRFENIISQKDQIVQNYKKHFAQHSLEKRFSFVQSNISQLKDQYNNIFKHILNKKTQELENQKNIYKLNEPSKKDKIGYAQVSWDNKLVDISTLEKNDKLIVQNSKYSLVCEVLKKSKLVSDKI